MSNNSVRLFMVDVYNGPSFENGVSIQCELETPVVPFLNLDDCYNNEHRPDENDKQN